MVHFFPFFFAAHHHLSCSNALLDKRGPGCVYHKNHMSLKADHRFLPSGDLNVWDIEDMIEVGKRKRGCPYFAARQMADAADLILCPYNYLMDPRAYICFYWVFIIVLFLRCFGILLVSFDHFACLFFDTF